MSQGTPRIDISRIKDQSHGPATKEFGDALRNRAIASNATVESLADALYLKDRCAVEFLSGWSVPTAEELQAMLPALNAQPMQPDVPAARDRQGRQLAPASYSSEKLRLQADLPHRLEKLRVAAMQERQHIAKPAAFDPVFLDLIPGEKRRLSPNKDQQKGTGHYLLKEAIVAPYHPNDTMARFVDLLCEYYDSNVSQLTQAIGYDSSVLANWKSAKSLPERNNFLRLRDWIENTFDHTTATKLTTLFVKEGLERYKADAQLRNLPPEYWAWKARVTRSPECQFAPDQPLWAEFVQPAQTRQEYFMAIRRAHKLFRAEFQAMTGVTPGQMQQFETGHADADMETIIKVACRTLDAARLASGDAMLYDEATFDALPSIQPTLRASNATRRASKAPSYTQDQLDRYDNQRHRIGNAEDCRMVGIPETLAEFATLDTRNISRMVDDARRYMRISDRQADHTIAGTVASELLRLHHEVKGRQIGID